MDLVRSSSRDWFVCILICMLVGTLGMHRFYCGKIGSGILYLITFGFFGIGYVIDLIMLSCKKFRDCEGLLVNKSSFMDKK